MFRNNAETPDNQTRVIYEQTNEQYEAIIRQQKKREKTTTSRSKSPSKKKKKRVLTNQNPAFQDQTRIIYIQPAPADEREEIDSLAKKIQTHAIQSKERQQQAQRRQLVFEQAAQQRLLDLIRIHGFKQRNPAYDPLQSLELLPEQEKEVEELILAKIKEKEAQKEQRKKEREYQLSQREHHTQQILLDVIHKHRNDNRNTLEPVASHASLNQEDNHLQNFYRARNQSPLFSRSVHQDIIQDKELMQSVENKLHYQYK